MKIEFNVSKKRKKKFCHSVEIKGINPVFRKIVETKGDPKILAHFY
jgi:hypothetical protein